jgi:hypothetical protein
MDFYKQYPMMRPYVGNNFQDATTPSLLLIGESHYLPKGSSQHLNAETWYASSSDTLSEKEIFWINTAAILEDSRAEGFSNRAHSIWRNSLWEINEHGPRYSDYKRVADDIAFYNFFLRPGLENHSLAVFLNRTLSLPTRLSRTSPNGSNLLPSSFSRALRITIFTRSSRFPSR